MGCKGNKTLESYFIEWTVPSGSLGSPRSAPCRLTAGEAGKSRAAVWPRLWVSIKQYGGGEEEKEEEECNQPDMPLRHAVSVYTHPVPPGGRWLQDAPLQLGSSAAGQLWLLLLYPCLTLNAFCLGPVFGLGVRALRGSCL